MFRRHLQSVLLALAAVTPFGVRAAVAPASVQVSAVLPGRVADLVVLDHGHDAGLREGMVCRLVRDGFAVAEVQLVGLRPAAAVALILQLAPGERVRPGDTAVVKTLKV